MNTGEVPAVEVEKDDDGNIVRCHFYSNLSSERDSVTVGSTVLVDVEAGPKFVALILEFIEDEEEEARARVMWFYRHADLLGAKVKLPKDFVTAPGQAKGQRESGRFKELFFSNHTDTASLYSFINTCKVWTLPNADLAPLHLPGAPSCSSGGDGGDGSSGGGAYVPLLPGFVCRYHYDQKNKKVTPLADILKRTGGNKEVKRLVFEQVAETARRLPLERQLFLDRQAMRGKRAAEIGADALKQEMKKRYYPSEGEAKALPEGMRTIKRRSSEGGAEQPAS